MTTKVKMLMPLTKIWWKACPNRPNVILGEWAEDSSEYEIIVPAQLRESILILQHSLCDRINEIETGKKFYYKKTHIAMPIYVVHPHRINILTFALLWDYP